MKKITVNGVQIESSNVDEMIEIINKLGLLNSSKKMSKTIIKNVSDKKHVVEKKNTQLSVIRKAMLDSKKPMHINEILKCLNRRGSKAKTNVASNIYSNIKKYGVFKKVAPNTFGLTSLNYSIPIFKHTKICEFCGKQYSTNSNRSKYCTISHRNKAMYLRLKSKKILNDSSEIVEQHVFTPGIIRRRNDEEIRIK